MKQAGADLPGKFCVESARLKHEPVAMRHLRWCWGQSTHASSRGCMWFAWEAWRAAPGGWSSSQSRRRRRSESPDLQTPSRWGSPAKTRVRQQEGNQSEWTRKHRALPPTPMQRSKKTYFPRVLGADGDAKLRSDESVVDEFGHVLKRLAIVLTGGQNPKWTAWTSSLHM